MSTHLQRVKGFGNRVTSLLLTESCQAARRRRVIRALSAAHDTDTSRAEVLAAEFLTGHTGHTANAYRRDLTDYFSHCACCPRGGADKTDVASQRYSAASLPAGLDPEVAHYDGILYWSCSHCGPTWHHLDLISRLHHIAANYLTEREDP